MPFFSEAQALGSNPSPWTVNGNDLYPDSTSYLVGIGLTDPEAYLHVKAINNTTGLKINQVGSGATYKFAEFKNEAATTETYAPYIYSDVINGYTRVRFVGSGGGPNWVFNDQIVTRGGIDFDGVSSNISNSSLYLRLQASTGFGMGASSFTPSGAMLHIKDASNPQLKLDDGTSSTTFQHDDNSGVPTLKMSASILEIQDAISGGGTQLVLKNDFGDSATFKQDETGQNFSIFTDDFDFKMYCTESSGSVGFADASGNRKVRYKNNENQFQISSGLRYDVHSTSSATYNMTTTDGRCIVLADSSSNAITINLPAASENNGRVIYIKDKGGNAGTNNITIDPNSSETIDAQPSTAINQNYGSMMIVCDGSAGWHIFG